jgi:DeoR/GlpR family transcriptional regulator of sugar metabolism
MSEGRNAPPATPEERREVVLRLVREGQPVDVMAGQLGVSAKTIRRDLKALNGKGHVWN